MPGYDVVIIGSGLGGLQCGYILSKEGYNVCVLEKHHQPGGCLQNFTREGCIFDTGIHYLGSLDEGQVLNRYFKYFGLMDKLPLKRMDPDGFDVICFSKDEKEYKYAMGTERFIESFSRDFPEEREGLKKYISKLKEISDHFPLYSISDVQTDISETAFYGENAQQTIASLIRNPRLQNVLAGTSPLYAGVPDKTPFYVHALINYSFIESSYRIMDGSGQIAELLCNSIKDQGGTVRLRSEAVKFHFANHQINKVELASGELIEADYIISDIHPASTLKMIPEGFIRPAYRHRLENLENTISSFSVYCVFKENSFQYLNYNIYHYDMDDVWSAANYEMNADPTNYLLLTPASQFHGDFVDSIIIMAYMDMREVKQWEHTRIGRRGQDYEEFKKRKAEKLIDLVEKKIPGFRNKIKSYYTSSPLTFRDYTGTPDGSLYGVLKDCNDPLKSLISPRTKIPNLLLTGQNIILHGALGVTIAAVTTCSELTGLSYLVNKIKAGC
jgi:all-trans-retinol 13,14-reductase